MKTETGREQTVKEFIRWLETHGMAIARNHEGGNLTRIYLAEEREEIVRRFMDDQDKH